jgi:hypothetical protein
MSKTNAKRVADAAGAGENIHAALDAEGHQVWYYGRWRPERVYGHGRLRRFKIAHPGRESAPTNQKPLRRTVSPSATKPHRRTTQHPIAPPTPPKVAAILSA